MAIVSTFSKNIDPFKQGSHSGLNFFYGIGLIRYNNVVTSVIAGTKALTDSATNYIEVNAIGEVLVNQVGYTSYNLPLYTVTTLGGAITNVKDDRCFFAVTIGGGENADEVNYDNTASLLTAINVQDAIDELQTEKVDKVLGKQLSTEDYTTIEKNKLAGIAEGAEVNVQSDWNAIDGDALILNKPTIPDAYTHPIGDGNLHVPATSTTNSGKVLTAGETEGSLSWQTPTSGGGTALDTTYDNTTSELLSTDVQGAIDELKELNNTLDADKANKVQENWVTPTLLNGWVNNGTPYENIGYYKDEFGIVRLKGVVKNGTLNQKAFILPEGYRPLRYMEVPVASATATTYGQVVISELGEVTPIKGTTALFPLDNISFRGAI